MKAQKRFYVGIKNEVSSGILELYFTDFIYNTWDWNTYEENNMVQDTIDQIKAANPTLIKIIINSLGGDVMIGLALYNYLKAYKAPKEVDIIGFAGSIASTLAMCGDTINMAKNSFMIIHAAWSGAVGNADEMRKSADNLDKVSDELADIYAQRSGKHDAAFFKALWKNGDYWMTGTEAKEMGLVTNLTNAIEVSASVDPKAYGYKNIPEAVLHAAAQPETQQTFFNHLEDKLMKLFDSLKATITGTKEDKKFDTVTNKEEILDLVNAVLQPEAETKPDAVVPTPEATKEPEVTDVSALVKPAEKTSDIQELKAMIEKQHNELAAFRAAVAFNQSTPQTDKQKADTLMTNVVVE